MIGTSCCGTCGLDGVVKSVIELDGLWVGMTEIEKENEHGIYR